MGLAVKRMMEMVRFLLIFVTCALMSYGVITFLSDHILPANPYREPAGNAVKVVKLLQKNETSLSPIDYERLQLFYLEGD
ncbi:DUF4227 family protein [Brevibacillus sp. SYSU BS000544]|uniref:DUF4227 family protein n=1 Tax=Brevibacillus sp. SYSU BS000544 TaxID=3416443 RepID=UPI003CE4FA20